MNTFLRDLRNRRKTPQRAVPISQHSQNTNHRALSTGAIQRALQDAKSLQGSELLDLQRVIGNRAVASILGGQKSPQEKSGLTVGAANDAHERAAHQVAGQVSSPNSIQRTAVPEVGDGGGHISQSLERQIQGAKGGGQPVPEQVQWAMENATGADYSDVRVHEGGDAQQINEGLGSRAATQGKHIFLGRDQSPNNMKLMAHELTHTVQQGAVNMGNKSSHALSSGGTTPSIQLNRENERRLLKIKAEKKLRDLSKKEIKKSKTGMKVGKGTLKALDILVTLPLRVIDELSITDRHIKDLVNFVRTGKTRKQRHKENPTKDQKKRTKRRRGNAWREFGRTGLRGYLGGISVHKTLNSTSTSTRRGEMPWRGKLNPFTQLDWGHQDIDDIIGEHNEKLNPTQYAPEVQRPPRAQNVEEIVDDTDSLEISKEEEQERDDLLEENNYNAGDLEMPEGFMEKGGFQLVEPEEEELQV